MAKHIVAPKEEIPPGEHKIVEIAGRSIGVYNLDGVFYALRNTCPHQGGPLCEGRITGFLMATKPGGEFTYTRRGEIVRCPWHGWEFDIKTGQSWFDPATTRVRTYPVQVERNPEGYVPGPYTAETYDVTVERDYVVVEVPG